jgi:nitronate monooxygenase
MDIVADARLTLAVADAGGFGFLGGGYGDEAWLRRELADLAGAARERKLPFGVGFITWSLARNPDLLDIALEQGASAIWLSFGDPAPFAPQIKAAGAKLVCQVQTEAMAKACLDAGADIRRRAGQALLCDGRSRWVPGSQAAHRRSHWRRQHAKRGVRHLPWPTPFTGRCLLNEHLKRWSGRELDLMRSIDIEGPRYAETSARRLTAAHRRCPESTACRAAHGLRHPRPPVPSVPTVCR